MPALLDEVVVEVAESVFELARVDAGTGAFDDSCSTGWSRGEGNQVPDAQLARIDLDLENARQLIKQRPDLAARDAPGSVHIRLRPSLLVRPELLAAERRLARQIEDVREGLDDCGCDLMIRGVSGDDKAIEDKRRRTTLTKRYIERTFQLAKRR